MSRVMMFMAATAVALVLSGCSARANMPRVGKPVTRAWHAPTVFSTPLDAEDTDDFSATALVWPATSASPAHTAGSAILETRKAARYPLPIFILQHRLLI